MLMVASPLQFVGTEAYNIQNLLVRWRVIMPKRSPKTAKDGSPKKLDPAITVALIALIGTLVTALFSSPVIIAWMQRTPAPIDQINPPSSQPSDPSATKTVPSSSALSGGDEGCLAQFFADIDPAKQVSIEVGAYAQDFYLSAEELATNDFVGPMGIKFTQNGNMIAALSFLFFPDSELFKITSIVDSKCQPISDYSNTSNSGDPNAVENSDNLQFRLPEGAFVLGFNFSGTDYIRFDLRQLR